MDSGNHDGLLDVTEKQEEDMDDEESSCSEDDDDDDDDDSSGIGEDDDTDQGTSNSDGDDEDDDDADTVSSSSGSDVNAESCAICLSRFKGQEVGVPESCDHCFCVDCIVEWSKNVNTCPIDRREFHQISVRPYIGADIYKNIPVQVDTVRTIDFEELDDTTACEVCGATDNEDRLLLCDSCNHGYHTYCLTPRLARIPRGDWYCPVCLPALEITQNQGVSVSADEDTSGSEPVHLGRTMVLERVRQTVARIRRSRANIIDSGSESSESVARRSVQRPSCSRHRRKPRRKACKRRKRVARRKPRSVHGKRRTKTKSTGTSKKRRKCRRRTKKKMRKLRTPTIAKRLAARLGIKPCIEGNRLIIKAQKKKPLLQEMCYNGRTSLDILGDYNQVIPYSDVSEREVDGDRPGLSAVARSAVPRLGPRIGLKQVSAGTPLSDGDTNMDLLGSILDGQNLLFADSESVIITRDGQLKWDTNNNTCRQRGDHSNSSDMPQDGGSDETNAQTNKEDSTNRTSTADTTAHHISHMTEHEQSGGHGLGVAQPANVPNMDGITYCLDEKDRDGGTHTSDEASPTKSKEQHCDSMSAHGDSVSPNSGRMCCAQSVATLESESSARQNDQSDGEQATDGGASVCNKNDAAGLMLVSDNAGGTPIPSYLYSPESPTSGTDSVHMGLSPAADDAMKCATDGGSTPVVDEVPTSASEQQVSMSDGGTTDLFHIVPFCELPKIPKIKKKPPEAIPRQHESSDSPPYAGVLERLNMVDKPESYPKWDKTQQNKTDRWRKSNEENTAEDDSDSGRHCHHGDPFKDYVDNDDSGSSYKHKHDHRSHSRDRDRSHDRDKDRRYDRDRRRRSTSSERSRRRSGSRSRSPHRRDRHIRDRYKDQEHAAPPSGRHFKLRRSFTNDNSSRCGDDQQGLRDGREKKVNPLLQEMDLDPEHCSHNDSTLPKETDTSMKNDESHEIEPRTVDLCVGQVITSPEPSSVFKMPEAPPPRFHKRDNVHLTGPSPDLSYDPSQPTEPERSPPCLEELLRAPSHMTHIHRQSPIQARLSYAEVVHRAPLLADPSPPREPHPTHFVTVPDSLRQMLPPLPGFSVIQPNIHPRNMRPPLLVNPPLISAHQIGRLPHLAGPQISWQPVSHPNVIIHNQIPIQVNQNGLPIHHPNGPEAFLQPPPHLEHPVPQSVPESLATPPPPIPPKALEEMQQISQLLNAQAQLADIATKGDGIIHFRETPPAQFPNSHCFPGPPAIIQNKAQNEQKSVTFEEKMEVIDMDVASPLSDQMATSGSPLEHSRDVDLMRKHPAQQHSSKGDHMPKSAAELDSNEKKLRQERVVEEVKLAIKPHYSKGRVDKEEYKEILRKAVPKICHSKSGDINPERIRKYIEQYVEKVRRARKHGAKNKSQ